MSDHECTTLEEASEKLKLGMRIMIREGSSEKNLDALIPLADDNNFKRCFFVVDDRNCADLLVDGDVDAVIRKAISAGIDPIRAIQMATINTAEYFRLEGHGAIAPGYRANLIVLNDIENLEVSQVFYEGCLVAERGEMIEPLSRISNMDLTHSVKIKSFEIQDLMIAAISSAAPVIGIVPDQIITKRRDEKPKIENNYIIPDVERDLLKLIVMERHRATGNIGRTFVKGFGLKKGALASSIAHDSHNIIAVGTNDQDIFIAINELERLQGGLVITAGGRILGSLALPVAGLLSEEPLQNVVQRLEELHKIAASLGCGLKSPFATLSFLALPVIPELRLTDKGLVDVNRFELI
jgi:adenine deaminase